MGLKLTQAQIQQYQDQGFVSPVSAFSREQAASFLNKFEEVESLYSKQLGKGFNFKPHLLFKWVDEIVTHPAVLDAVEDLIGPNFRVFHLTVWPKNAHDAAYTAWHQDATYFGLEPHSHVTAWVALSDATIESGCVEVVPGSHKLGQLHHSQDVSPDHPLSKKQWVDPNSAAQKQTMPANLLSKGQSIDENFDQSHTEFMIVPAGQFSLHHTHLIHRSGANQTDNRRIGLGISYIPTDVRCTSKTRLSAMMVRGVDEYGHFDDEPRPQVDFGAAEQAFHHDSMARYKESNDEQAAKY
jgi:non-heme Fe2+,alpha-ketoglutarate-dependent halogenase